jgi:hypothetical protein
VSTTTQKGRVTRASYRRRRRHFRCSRTLIKKKMRRSNNNKNTNRKRRPPPPSIIGGDDDVIASRTRCKRRSMVAKWDLQTPIIIEIVGRLDQESLMNLSLVSKQLHDIIANEPGNKNKIIPVFEISINSKERLFQNLRGYFLNKKTAKKLQSYQIMRFNDLSKIETEIELAYSTLRTRELQQIVFNVQMYGITSLDLSLPFPTSYTNSILITTYALADSFPNLREADFSNTGVDNECLRRFSENCPLLEKITIHNNDAGIGMWGYAMKASNNLKEIHMDNSKFHIWNKITISDLNNHQDIFMFHECCKALERFSVRNIKYRYVSDDEKLFTQNVLIKFVRNAPPTLRWLRSDLTPDNMTMLRIERPGIELLN